MIAHKVMTLCISFNGMHAVQFMPPPPLFDSLSHIGNIHNWNIFPHLGYKQLHESDGKVFVERASRRV